MVDVVREANRDVAGGRRTERAADDLVQIGREVEVVDGDVERRLRRAEECGQRVRGVRGRLAAVGQRADFDRLYSRFAAW
jgi:hypothetical protein